VTEPLAAAARDAGSTPLRDWQLLDWRFLVPAQTGRVAYVGPVSPAELAVAREAGVDLVADPSPQQPVQLVVVPTPDAHAVDRALAVLAPGGWLLVRATAAAAPLDPLGPLRMRRWRRRLAARGLRAVRAYWHAPDLRRCSYIVDTGDPVAVNAMLRRFHGVRFGFAKSAAGRALNRVRLVEAAVRNVTLVAWLPDDRTVGTPPPGMPVQPVLPAGEALDAASWSTLFMTPWFEASRHVLALYVARDTGGIAAVAKLPRRAWDVGGIETEAAALRTVGASGSALVRAAPQVLDERFDGARPYLLQSGVGGTAIGPEVVRRSPGLVLDAGTTLIEELATGGTAGGTSASVERLVDVPLDRLATALSLPETRRLVQRSKEMLGPLRAARLPAVLEHGDFGHPNLILTRGDRMAAIDWERFDAEGLPALDLVFFLQYVKECLASAVTIESQLRAFDAAFVGPGAWAAPLLSSYAARLEIPEALLPHLVLATWCRTAAGLVPRLEPPRSPASQPQGPSARHLAETITGDRDYVLWRHAVARFDAVLP
jgi:aminoglycoside phosphotransferase (APT) family kinase protein